MAKLSIVKASTDVTQYVFIQDSSSTTGAGLTGLAYNTASLVCYYVRPLAAAAVLTLATQTVTGAHSDGGFVEIDATNMPGVYRLDLSDAVCATGVNSVLVMLKGATNMAPVVLEIQLTSVNLNDAVRAGMTALPNAAADAAGGLAISDAGGLDLDTKLANTNEITVARMGALTDWIDAGRLDAILDAILVDTGTTLDGKIDTIDGIVDTILVDTNELQVDWTNAGRLDNILDTIAADVVNIDGAAMRGTDGANTTVPDAAGTAATLHGTTDGLITTIDTVVDAIKLVTDNLPNSGALTGISGAITALNDLSAAEVNAEVDTALSDIHLDHLLAVDYDPAVKPGVATALLNELVESDVGVSRFTTNALEQAPSGTGGDASAANQTTIINHLLDIKDGADGDFSDTADTLHDLRAKLNTISGDTPVNINHESTTVVRGD